MAKLTKQAVERAVKDAQRQRTEGPKAKQSCVLWDDTLKGFGVRISSTGRATWIIKTRLGAGGRKAKQVLSSFGTLALIEPEEARRRARTLLEEVSSGVDPEQRKRQQRHEQHATQTSGKLSEVWNLWLARKRNDKGKKRPVGRSYWDGIVRLGKVEVIPTLGSDTLVGNITKKDIRSLIEKTEDRSKPVARMLFAALNPFFSWCLERELITVNPMTDLSPPDKSKARARVLTDSELVLVWSAASSMPYPWGPFYKLLILTAQRRDEVANVPWTELDLSKKHEWIIPGIRTKNGKEHLVHLSNWAVSTLHSIADQSGDTYVFTTIHKAVEGVRTEVPVSGFSKAKKTLDKKIKELNGGKAIPRWTVHDLRRTAATGMAALGVPPHITERILNHVSGVTGGLTGIYQRFEYPEERKQALANWANHINELLLADMAKEREEREATNVVSFR